MRTRDYLEGLTQLHRLEDPEERRGLWRQSLATLGATIVNLQHPAPLEGLDPDYSQSAEVQNRCATSSSSERFRSA